MRGTWELSLNKQYNNIFNGRRMPKKALFSSRIISRVTSADTGSQVGSVFSALVSYMGLFFFHKGIEI